MKFLVAKYVSEKKYLSYRWCEAAATRWQLAGRKSHWLRSREECEGRWSWHCRTSRM